MSYDQNPYELNTKNSNVQKNDAMEKQSIEDDIEDLEISGLKRLVRNSKKRKMYVSDEESDDNDQILQNQEEARVMKKKNFMESFCDKSKEQSSCAS